MIRATVTLPAKHSDEIIRWLHTNVGYRALFANNVSEEFPWFNHWSGGKYTYMFAREEDAVIFKLRWL